MSDLRAASDWAVMFGLMDQSYICIACNFAKTIKFIFELPWFIKSIFYFNNQ